MDKTLEHLPPEKQAELEIVKDVILEKVPDVRMVILFGSYARGDWVEDILTENKATHVYLSDFDILVATKSKKVADDHKISDTVEQNINATDKVETPYSIIYHTFGYIKERLTEGHYFFTDIQKEGVYLFHTNKHGIGAIEAIPPKKRKIIAQEHFDQWSEKAKHFHDNYEFNLNKGRYKMAAFELHQATECVYSVITLVYINYRFRTHDLERLNRKAISYDPNFATAFPRDTEEQKKLFTLLRKAYIDARYKETYKITKTQLKKLATKVQKLQTLTEKICAEKIKSFTR